MSVGNLRDKLEGSEIDLGLLNLTTVPVEELAEVPEATRLDFSSNKFVTLPDAFCRLTHLVWLDLSKNRLRELPEDFGFLVNLQHLDLLGNELKRLPASFSQLRRLTWLDLKGNPLDPELSRRAGDCDGADKCRACAQNVLRFMRKEPEVDEKKEKEEARKWGRVLYDAALQIRRWLFRVPAAIAMGVTLFVFTLLYSAKKKASA